MPEMKAFDARWIAGAWAIEGRVLRRRVGRIVDGKGVLADDLAARVDPVGNCGTHACNGKIERSVLPVREHESVLSAAGSNSLLTNAMFLCASSGLGPELALRWMWEKFRAELGLARRETVR